MAAVLRVARVVYASGCGGHQVPCTAYGGGVVAASGFCRVSFVCRWACRHGGGFRCRVGVLHPRDGGGGEVRSRPHRGVPDFLLCAGERHVRVWAVSCGGARLRLHRLPVCSFVPTPACVLLHCTATACACAGQLRWCVVHVAPGEAAGRLAAVPRGG
ncbi:hypothetical protein TraAM80_09525 [Trypanosoma rangeli]|uniref:Uncharacterized protein n=1 Tax=Trypanosoma rangeli TaxID=5698 RepID=A0A422MVV0_TRYRA|nr:uncharacterized protein TraAM80_09525 [Trypanosoma rangeli]RNE97281.1 hypothetical protein TraAM80_09525 [Trypanosoma rangeli]|eukprot:RNE97281.1 hypothetical protein TraAM80_09525 [Trypanosoma rangeli]